MLWDEDMTREEYLATMDEFLQVYYGAGWTYVRQYIDKIGNTGDADHKTYTRYNSMLGRSKSKNDLTFVNDCIALLEKAQEAAETPRHARNVERTSAHLYQLCIEMGARTNDIRIKADALAKKYGLVKEYD